MDINKLAEQMQETFDARVAKADSYTMFRVLVSSQEDEEDQGQAEFEEKKKNNELPPWAFDVDDLGLGEEEIFGEGPWLPSYSIIAATRKKVKDSRRFMQESKPLIQSGTTALKLAHLLGKYVFMLPIDVGSNFKQALVSLSWAWNPIDGDLFTFEFYSFTPAPQDNLGLYHDSAWIGGGALRVETNKEGNKIEIQNSKAGSLCFTNPTFAELAMCVETVVDNLGFLLAEPIDFNRAEQEWNLESV